ncbi:MULTISPECIES: DUF7385 family protein [Haloferax]|uniref:Uncharacterized protein n=3 Tax=Haloferax TaxID=2251 RepID=M0IB18_9EURY|nr:MULTISPECIES: hypothetical protein [Haloferax]ELZ93242.1 hypothetical protein C441_10151 [Haloferax sulfurifontis ATCC BAA-897]EMA06036.1 hypothetical protein C438_09422 [Haloferax denitrificans ATCC 35960]GGC53201.1 hypothetical protein GCM10007209_13610 [Haloferax sulfurifontis]
MNDEELDELRSSLTPYESSGGVTTYQNTVSIACPACEKPFDDLVVCENDYNSLELSMMLDLCVTQHDGDVLLFTHKQED